MHGWIIIGVVCHAPTIAEYDQYLYLIGDMTEAAQRAGLNEDDENETGSDI
jgi:hypothetical protein